MPSVWFAAAIVVPTVAFAVVVWRVSRRFDGILLVMSGIVSLMLALFAGTTMSTENGMMAFEMSEKSFNAGVLSPVYIVATLTVMRGLFKFLGE